mgnify:CR=1 FL=1
MANKQQLGEFIDNILDDLQSGAITTEEAIVASSQYEYMRALLSQHAQDLSSATAESDESLKATLLSIFSQTKSRLLELPAFSSQAPDVLRDEKQTRNAAELEHFAFETIRKETKTRAIHQKQTRREFIHALVSQYSIRTSSIIPETKMDTAVDAALSLSSREPSSQEAQQKFVKGLTAGLGISDPAFEKIIGSTISKDATSTVLGSWRETNMEREALATLFTHADLSRPDVVADVFLHAGENALLSDVSVRAVKLAQTAEAVASLGTKPLTTRGPFFSNSNTRGAIKGAQQAADSILSLVGEPLREMLLKEKINGTLRSVITGVNQLSDRLGEKFIHSSVFGFVTQNILKGANEKPTMSQSTAIFGDVFGAVFRGPLNIATNQGTKEKLFDYFELARASSNAPKGFSFLGPNIMPWHIESMRSQYAMSFKKSTIQRGWLPSVGLYKLGSLGGDALASAFDRFVGFAFAGPSISRQLHASRRAAAVPTPLSEDLPLLLSLVVIATIVILFVFPTFLNIPHLSIMQKMSALLASLQSKGEDFHEDNRNFPVPDFGPIKQSPNACIQYGAGTSAPDNKKSYQFNSSQQDKMNTALKAYPQIGLYSCILECPANAVNFTAFNTTSSSGYWAWAPSAKPGYIFFYDGAFSASSTRSLARLIAHELAHQIQYSKINIYNSYLAKGYCGPLGTYGWIEWPSETFAEAAGMYMIGDPLLKQKCEKGYSFMQNMFSTCQ